MLRSTPERTHAKQAMPSTVLSARLGQERPNEWPSVIRLMTPTSPS